jgi:hypothetical protein
MLGVFVPCLNWFIWSNLAWFVGFASVHWLLLAKCLKQPNIRSYGLAELIGRCSWNG